MSAKANLHRETLRAALRVVQTADTIEHARTQLARMLNIFDKLQKNGMAGDPAVHEAEKRLATTAPPKPSSSSDQQPVRRREPG